MSDRSPHSNFHWKIVQTLKEIHPVWCAQNAGNVPRKFDTSSMTVALIRIHGFLLPAMLKQGSFAQLTLAGFTFLRRNCGDNTDFFLVQDKYSIDRDSKENVYLDKIGEDKTVELIGGNVIQFLAKGQHLFLLETNESCESHRILNWIGSRFIPLRTTACWAENRFMSK